MMSLMWTKFIVQFELHSCCSLLQNPGCHPFILLIYFRKGLTQVFYQWDMVLYIKFLLEQELIQIQDFVLPPYSELEQAFILSPSMTLLVLHY